MVGKSFGVIVFNLLPQPLCGPQSENIICSRVASMAVIKSRPASAPLAGSGQNLARQLAVKTGWRHHHRLQCGFESFSGSIGENICRKRRTIGR
jgi:hypothetical protein